MKQSLPNQVTVLVDSREKYPLQFPSTFTVTEMGRPHILKVVVEVKTLKTADYAIKGHEPVSLVERKGSMEEVWKNMCTADFSRFSKMLDRLTKLTKLPCLLLDFPIIEAFKSTEYCPDPQQALLRLFRRCVRGGVHVMWLPRSRSEHSLLYTGSLVLQWLWATITTEGLHVSNPIPQSPRREDMGAVADATTNGDPAINSIHNCQLQT